MKKKKTSKTDVLKPTLKDRKELLAILEKSRKKKKKAYNFLSHKAVGGISDLNVDWNYIRNMMSNMKVKESPQSYPEQVKVQSVVETDSAEL